MAGDELSSRVTRARVDLGAIAHNLRLLRALVQPGAEVMAVVKADAYGHGAIAVARTCIAAGATRLAVAIVDEGVTLRQAGITAPVLVLGPSAPEEHARALRHDLGLTVGSLRAAQSVSAAAHAAGKTACVHVKVDTGMTRFGVLTVDQTERAADEMTAIGALPHLFVEGIFTHFATSEEADKTVAHLQLGRFNDLLEELEGRGMRVPLRHASNSGAILNLPAAHLDMARPGIALYGYHPAGMGADARGLRPALALHTRLMRVERVPAGTGVGYNHTFRTERPSVVGLAPIGYADGLPRLLANRGHMLVRGQRCPVAGRVSMDQTVLDVTDVPGVSEGDPVVVIGEQGAERIGADEVGLHAGTNAYETLCRISARVPRDYAGA